MPPPGSEARAGAHILTTTPPSAAVWKRALASLGQPWRAWAVGRVRVGGRLGSGLGGAGCVLSGQSALAPNPQPDLALARAPT